MKILVCGKGGCGKSTIVTLLAKELAGREKPVLIIDSDESNFGLHNLLGMEQPKDFMNYFGGKKLLFKRVGNLKEELKIESLPEEYIAKKGNIKLLVMGKIYEFGEGCACPINVLSAKFIEKILLDNDQFLVADTDAGVEHLGRGVEKGCDILLAVVEPSRESIELAKRVSQMAKKSGTSVYYILNKIDKEPRESFLKFLDGNKIIAVVPYDKRISLFGLEGGELNFKLEGINKIADFLNKRSLMK